jgi:hypothetical protein
VQGMLLSVTAAKIGWLQRTISWLPLQPSQSLHNWPALYSSIQFGPLYSTQLQHMVETWLHTLYFALSYSAARR